MKKAIRRHQQKVAKVRYQNILRARWGWPYWFVIWHNGEPEVHLYNCMDKPWRTRRQLMREPGHWEHEMEIQPARIRTNRMLRLVELGHDPDSLEWPDFKRPQIWYW